MACEYTIVVDTREQKPLWTGDKIERKKLNAGDYSILGEEDNMAIERKSLSDLFSTLGMGHKRFKAELDRVKDYDYFAIVVDGNYSDVITKNYPKSYLTKMKGYMISSILFTIHMKYKIPIFFGNNRVISKRIIKELFNAYYKQKKVKEGMKWASKEKIE